jgi:hypothetical protein
MQRQRRRRRRTSRRQGFMPARECGTQVVRSARAGAYQRWRPRQGRSARAWLGCQCACARCAVRHPATLCTSHPALNAPQLPPSHAARRMDAAATAATAAALRAPPLQRTS